MTVSIRSAITVLTALFVLAKLCSANSPATQSTSDENKLTWPSTGAVTQNGKFQSSGETSKDDEFRERTDLVNVRRTCANLTTEQLQKELITRVTNQIFKRSKMSSSENAERVRKRIVYPTAVNSRKNTIKFILNAAEIIGRPIVIKLWLSNEKNGCPLRSEVKVDLSNIEKENLNCVDAMKKRYLGLFHGKNYDSKDVGRISFDVSELTVEVLRNVKDVCKNMDTAKLTIRVKARKCSSSPKDKIQNPRQPYLEILPVAPSTPLQCTRGETRCCMQTTAVMLREVASFIFMPKGYRTGYCRGTCEDGLHNDSCCVPTKTAPLSILYYTQGIVKMRVLPDVVVRECGCR